jgi:glutaredoxin
MFALADFERLLRGKFANGTRVGYLRPMEVRRCGVHGLVLGDDAKCVICRRGDAVLEPPKTSSDWPIVAVLAVTAVALVISFGVWLSRNVNRREPVKEDVVVAAPPPQASEAAELEQAARPTTVREELPQPQPQPQPSIPIAEVVDDDTVIEAQKRKVPVTMFMTPKCSLCNSARTFMKARGYRLQELNVEASPTDAVLLKAENPAGTVPTFDVSGRILVGYDPTILDEAIANAAKKVR